MGALLGKWKRIFASFVLVNTELEAASDTYEILVRGLGMLGPEKSNTMTQSHRITDQTKAR